MGLDDAAEERAVGVPQRHRACQLLDLVEKAICKAVVGRDTEDVVSAFGGPLLGASAEPEEAEEWLGPDHQA